MAELICDADGIRLSRGLVLAERRGATIVPHHAHEIFRRLAPEFGADLDWTRLNGAVGRAARFLTDGRPDAAQKALEAVRLPRPLAKFNTNHYGPGPRGGQFAPAEDGGGVQENPERSDADNAGGTGAQGEKQRSANEQKKNYTEQLAGSGITGFTDHGINRAIERGIPPSAIVDAVRNPIRVIPQSGGRTMYVGKRAVVILNSSGGVITLWGQ